MFNADNPQDRSASAKLNLGAHSYFHRRADLPAIDERAKPRIGIKHGDVAFAQPELGVLARDHRPLLLGKEVMTDGRVATNQDFVIGE